MNLVGNNTFEAAEPPPLTDVLVGIFPTNPVQAMAEGNMLLTANHSIALWRGGPTRLNLYTPIP